MMATEPIAIVGMSGRFPGARDLDEFATNLFAGRESIVDLPHQNERADLVNRRPLLADADGFDAEFFGMTPREAELFDPHHRLFLETAHATLAHAGYDPHAYRGTIGVFACTNPSRYLSDHLESRPHLLDSVGGLVEVATMPDFVSTFVSYRLDLRGPSVTTLTACSSSLVAVHLACGSIRRGESDLAIAGGVSVQFPYRRGYRHEPGGVTSADGVTRPFDDRAAGANFGEGVGAVLLKPLSRAVADRDTVYAVLRGSAINNDGNRKVGFSAPSVAGQSECVAAALREAGVDPRDVSYVEAHGTGTRVGDPIELTALTEAFRAVGGADLPNAYCGLGSVKANIGHLGAAAGIAGLLKTVVALTHERLPASINVTRPTTAFDWADSPFRLVTETTPWPAGQHRPRIAGVSSFGVGGTNSHVVITEAPRPVPADRPGRATEVVLWSAVDQRGEERVRDRLTDYFAGLPDESFADAAHTLRTGRTPLTVRGGLMAARPADAATMLRAGAGLVRGDDRDRAIVFAFPEPSSPPAGMMRELYRDEPLFRAGCDASFAVLTPLLGTDLRELWLNGDKQLTDPAIARPLLYAVEYTLANCLLHWGVRPRVLVGVGVGELVAAAVAGVLDFESGLRMAAALARTDMAPADLEALLDDVCLREPECTVLSAGGERIATEQLTSARFWARRLSGPPTGTPASELAHATGAATVLEVGPDETFSTIFRTGNDDDLHRAIPLASGPGTDALRYALAQLWVDGEPITYWHEADAHGARRIATPAYPYDRRRHWVDPATEPDPPVPNHASARPPGPALAELQWYRDPAARPGPDAAANQRGGALILSPGEHVAVLRSALTLAGYRPTVATAFDTTDPQAWAAALENASDDLELVVHGDLLSFPPHVTADTVAALLDSSVYGILACTRSLARLRRRRRRPIALVLLGRHLLDVSGAEPVNAAAGAATALMHTIRAEHPDISTRCLDIAGRPSPAALAEEFGRHAEPLVALRGTTRWLPALRTLPETPASLPLRPDGTYLVTGGLGGLGLVVARALADTGTRPRLALLGRSAGADLADDHPTRAALAGIAAAGAEVDLVRADVCDLDALRAAVSRVEHRFGAVAGVVHAAGVPGGGLVERRSVDKVRAVLGAKVAGLLNLDQVFRDRAELDFLVLFSSVAGLAGVYGSGDYAAANAFLDGYARARLAPSGHTVSVQWPGWRQVGMAAEAEATYGAALGLVTEPSPAPTPGSYLYRSGRDWELGDPGGGRRPRLPAAVLLDLALRAVRATGSPGNDVPLRFDDVVFPTPLVTEDSVEVRVVLSAVAGRHRFQVQGRTSAASPWTDHAIGMAQPAIAAEPSLRCEPAHADAPELLRGPAPGPRWRSVVGLRGDRRAREARLVLPAEFHADLASYPLHPALLDLAWSVFQDGTEAHAPFLCRQLVVNGPLTANVRVLATLRESATAGGQPGVVDLDIVDITTGAVLVAVTGLVHRRAPEGEPPSTPTAPGATAPTEPEPLDPAVGAELFLRIVSRPQPPVVLVATPGVAEFAGLPWVDESPAGSVSGGAPPAGSRRASHVVDRAHAASVLRELWADVLGKAARTDDDDFFKSGGDSLAAVALSRRIRERLGVELSAGDMFDVSTIATMATTISG